MKQPWRSITLSMIIMLAIISNAAAEESSLISPLTRFDPAGRLPQSDAASQVVAKGGPLVAISTRSAILLVAPSIHGKENADPLVKSRGLPKMLRLTNRVCLSHAGLSQDSRVLLLAAQQAAVEHEDHHGEEMSVAEVVEVIAGKQQEATMQGNKRPFGSSILIAGLLRGTRGTSFKDEGEKERKNLIPRIYRTDPSGAYTIWKACAIGQGAEKVMTILEDRYREDLTIKEALTLALDCCRVFYLPAADLPVTFGTIKGEKCNDMPSPNTVVVDMALVSYRGVQLWGGVSSPEKIAATLV